MKKIISYVVVAVMLVCVFGCSPGKTVDIDLKGDKMATVNREQILYINIEANPTTGYVWQIAGEYNENILKRIGKYGYKHNSDRLGAGGVQTFRFEAVKKGQTNLVFEYSRPWEKEEKPAKKYTLRIIVH